MSSATKQPPSTTSGLPIVPLVIGFLILAAVAAVLLSGGGDDPTADGTQPISDENQFGAVAVSGAALPPLAGAQPSADPAVGQPAPTLEGTDFTNGPVALPGSERPTLVVFAAHWCPHCQAEIPRIVDWMAAGGGQDIDIVAVSTAADAKAPNWPPQAWLEREAWTAPVLVDDQEGSARTAYGVDGYPFFTLVDADGTAVWRASGEIGTDALDEVLAQL